MTYYGQLAQIRLGSKGGNPKSWAVVDSADSQGIGIPAKLDPAVHFQKLKALRAALKAEKDAATRKELQSAILSIEKDG
ncbi:MAG: hypothetical protein IH918_06140 [Acidobacteria bacterium]|nr:hypothetical protein [Acidobacteriota bacterium]